MKDGIDNNTLSLESATAKRERHIKNLLNDILDMTLKVFNVDAGFIRIYEEATRELIIRAHRGIDIEDLEMERQVRKYGVGRSWACILSGRPAVDLRSGENTIYYKGFGYSLIVPLRSGNRLIGTINLFSRDENHFPKYDLGLFSYIGNQIGVAIDHARLLKQVEKRTGSLEALYAISRTVNQTLNIDQLLGDTLDIVIKVLDAESGLIRLLEEETQELVLNIHRGFAPEEIKNAVVRRKYGEGSAWRCARRGVPEIRTIAEAGADSFRKKAKISTTANIPLMSKNRLMGIMAVHRRSARPFDSGEIELFTHIGDLIGVAIDNARLFQETTRRNSALAALQAISQNINQTLNLDQVLSEAIDKVIEALQVDTGLIRLLNEAQNELVVRAHRGFKPEEIKHLVLRRKLGEGSSGQCFERGKPEIRTRANAAPSSFRYKANIFITVDIPLVSKNRPMGIMSIHQRTPRTFTAGEIEFFTHIGNLIGVAIENARLFRQTEERSRALSTLFAISQTINRSLDLEQVLNDALAKIMELFQCFSTHIRLLDDKTQELVLVAHKGFLPEAENELTKRRRPGEGTSSHIVASGEVLAIGDINADPRTAGKGGFASRIGCRALVSVPLFAREKLLGTLSIHYREPRIYTEEELQLFSSIGHQIGTAVENARLYREKEATITELRETQEKLHQAWKMEAIGTLAGGIAHDFNNLMMVIMGNASLMLMDTDPNHPHYKMLKTIEQQVESGSKLTGQLLGYARKGKYFLEIMDINGLLEDTFSALSRVKKEIAIHFDLAPDLKALEGDRGQMEQMLLNLYANAVDAMPGGGDLYLRTCNAAPKDLTEAMPVEDGPYVLLEFRDTGVGMDKETQKRIFDPFFTTKGMGRGTGLGLASVYGIVKSHNGYIVVDSEKNRGATFRIYLPASEKQVEKKKEEILENPRGHGTILMVDDEEMLLQVGQEMLKSMGYSVITADGGSKSVELFRKNKDSIDLVILDMIMPGMGGGEAYDRMKEISGNVKVLLSSGYSIDGQARQILARGCNGFIQKPFGLKDLSHKIRAILAVP